MICRKCGSFIAEDSSFCACCGEKAAPAAPSTPSAGGFFTVAGNLDGSAGTHEISAVSPETKKASGTAALRISRSLMSGCSADEPGANEPGAMGLPGTSKESGGSGLTGCVTSGPKKHCTNCGAETKEDSKFCAVCGKAVNTASGYSAEKKKNAPNKRKYLIAVISIAACLLLLVSLAILLPAARVNSSNWDRGKLDTNLETEAPKIDTAYPDAVSRAPLNVITVEKAEEDLRENKQHECLENGTVTFDTVTYEYPTLDSVNAIYWFDIAVPWEYGSENYRAKITYSNVDDEFRLSGAYDACEIWQVDHQFTKLGVWQYDDGETSIWINFIERDGNAYVVEYEINYCAHYWSSREQIAYSTNGSKKVYGDNEWNGETYYLLIDLGDIRHEDGSESSLGYIKVYPWSGVYWDALHVYGGPYKLYN